MKKLKKVLAMIICSMMVFSLVGCDNSSNGNSDAPSASDNGGNTQDPNATPKPITLETAIDINKLSDAKKFSEAGYSDKILKLDSKEGVCIGKYDLSKYDRIVISYSGDASAPMALHQIYLKDAKGNVIASKYLKNNEDGSWVNAVRDVEMTFNSSYNGDLYLSKSDYAHCAAVSKIVLYCGGATESTEKYFQGTQAELVAKILAEAQVVTDFARDKKFTYGNASINPGINWAELDTKKAIKPSEKLSSCDRLVDWVLYRCGFTNQRYNNGYYVEEVKAWIESMGFEKITDVSKLKAGDIVFTGNPSDPGPGHVFICASENLGGNVYLRYDHGSTERIQCTKGTEVTKGKQPFKEPITGMFYAYRPVV